MLESVQQIKALIGPLKGDGTFRRLEAVYGRVPPTTCGRCGACCKNGVQMWYTEFLHVCEAIARKDLERQHPQLLARLVQYWWAQMVRPEESCPFFEDNSCIIYDWRPLNCRLFGIVPRTEEDCEHDQGQIAQLATRLEQEGVTVPQETLTAGLPACDRVRPLGRRSFSLDAEQLMEGFPFQDVDGRLGPGGFPQQLGRELFGTDCWRKGIDAMRQYQAGMPAMVVTRRLIEALDFRFADLAYRRHTGS